jgi:peptidoglycan lytic transglycosylase
LRAALAVAMGLLFAACSLFRAPPPPPAITPPSRPVIGFASWYGPGFDGHRTASGEIYNQEDLTAASSLYPLGSRVMVTNLDNGRAVAVTINDRGPFKKGRKIDLSHKAAEVIGMIGPGTARVRIDLLGAPAGSRLIGAPRYFVQVGSFADSANARRMRKRLAPYYRDVHIEEVDASGARFYRVRMGAFSSRSAAQSRAAAAASLGLPVLIVSE